MKFTIAIISLMAGSALAAPAMAPIEERQIIGGGDGCVAFFCKKDLVPEAVPEVVVPAVVPGAAGIVDEELKPVKPVVEGELKPVKPVVEEGLKPLAPAAGVAHSVLETREPEQPADEEKRQINGGDDGCVAFFC